MAKRTPKITVVHAKSPRYVSLSEAWQMFGSALARILAAVIGRDKAQKISVPKSKNID